MYARDSGCVPRSNFHDVSDSFRAKRQWIIGLVVSLIILACIICSVLSGC